MGHYTENCAVSGLPIPYGTFAYCVQMAPNVRGCHGSKNAPYHLMQVISNWQEALKQKQDLLSLLTEKYNWTPEQVQEKKDTFDEDYLVEECPYFTLSSGYYNNYGALSTFKGQGDHEAERPEEDHIFIHGEIWDYVQFKSEWGENPFDRLFFFMFTIRQSTSWGHHYGAQDWEEDEYHIKNNFLYKVIEVQERMRREKFRNEYA